jgi:hypothetical protein
MQFESAVQLLCDAGVDFVVVAERPLQFHGSVRVTYDLDICYSRVADLDSIKIEKKALAADERR